MSAKNALVFLLFVAFQGINCYCDFKSRKLHTGISRGLIQANKWLIEEQDSDGKWINLHTTGNALAVLKMIGYDATKSDGCKQTFQKASEYFMMNKYQIMRAYGGRLAYIIMGLNALCEDPSKYYGMNLTHHLLEDVMNFPKGNFNHFFQYSLALTALGINDIKVPLKAVERLINKIQFILKTKEKHTKDDCAMFIMAMKSTVEQFKGQTMFYRETHKYINMLANALAMKTTIDKDNLWTKSLVMQAQSAIGRSLPWPTTKCESLYKSLLSEKTGDGSFGGLSAVLHVLPTLAGVSFLDLKKDGHCQVKMEGQKNKSIINVCVKIEFEAIRKANPEPQYVKIPEGSTALDALKEASKLHGCYKLETEKTVWGEYVTKICNTPKSDTKKVYWMFYVDEKMATKAVSSHIVEPNKCIVMKYEKLNFKK